PLVKPNAVDSVRSAKAAAPKTPPALPNRPVHKANPALFDFDELPDEPVPVRRRATRRKSHGFALWKGFVLGGCILLVVGALAIFIGPSFLPLHQAKKNNDSKELVDAGKKSPESTHEIDDTSREEEPVNKGNPKTEELPKVVTVGPEPFPRRALLIS